MRHQPATSGYTSFCLRSTTAEICEEDVYQGPLSGNLRCKSLCWGQSSGHQIRWGLRLWGWPLRGRWGRIQLCQKVARGEASSRTNFRSKVETWLFSQPAMPLVSEKMQTGDPGGGERRGGVGGTGSVWVFHAFCPLALAPRECFSSSNSPEKEVMFILGSHFQSLILLEMIFAVTWISNWNFEDLEKLSQCKCLRSNGENSTKPPHSLMDSHGRI